MAEPKGERLCPILFLTAGSISDGLDVCFDMDRRGWVVIHIQLSCGIVDNIFAITITSIPPTTTGRD